MENNRLSSLLEQIREAAYIAEGSAKMVDDIIDSVGKMGVKTIKPGKYEITAWVATEKEANKVVNKVSKKWGGDGVKADINKVDDPADEDGKYMINIRLPD